MNRFLICIVSVLMLLSFCSCSEKSEPGEDEPQSMPELESIVEPVAGDEPSSEPEQETAPVHTPGVIPSSSIGPVSETETGSGSQTIPTPAVSHESEHTAPQMLEAVAPALRLDNEIIEKELLRLINALRDETNVNALGIEDGLQFAARIRAAEALDSFSHTRPDGAPYNTAFDEAGFSYAGKLHGENLSSLSFSFGDFNEAEIALEMFKGLKNSPGHYRNMTEKDFVQAGVGVAIIYTDNAVDITSSQMFSSI